VLNVKRVVHQLWFLGSESKFEVFSRLPESSGSNRARLASRPESELWSPLTVFIVVITQASPRTSSLVWTSGALLSQGFVKVVGPCLAWPEG